MTKSADDLIYIPARTDGVTRGDMTSDTGNAVPSREPITRGSTLGTSAADMVSGEGGPVVPQAQDAIEKLSDSRTTLPAPERQI